MPADPQYAPLTDGEEQWVAAHARYGRDLGADPTDVASIEEFFDAQLAANAEGRLAPEDANAIINVIAVLLGEHLRMTANVDWAIVTDEFGTDLCVYRPENQWTFFPQSSVAKRWETKESGWIRSFAAWAAERTRDIPGT